MQTEEKVKIKCKAERRKVFWRLYSLPWLLSILFLIFLFSSFIYVLDRVHVNNLGAINNARIEGTEIGYKKALQEAVLANCGKWEVSRTGIVNFQWEKGEIILPTRVITNEIIREIVITNEVIREVKIRAWDEEERGKEEDYLFSKKDYLLAKELRIDLQGNLKRDCQSAIKSIFQLEEDSQKREEKLLTEIERRIDDNFKGFKLYNQIGE